MKASAACARVFPVAFWLTHDVGSSIVGPQKRRHGAIAEVGGRDGLSGGQRQGDLVCYIAIRNDFPDRISARKESGERVAAVGVGDGGGVAGVEVAAVIQVQVDRNAGQTLCVRAELPSAAIVEEYLADDSTAPRSERRIVSDGDPTRGSLQNLGHVVGNMVDSEYANRPLVEP